jgi:hypothetical protein
MGRVTDCLGPSKPPKLLPDPAVRRHIPDTVITTGSMSAAEIFADIERSRIIGGVPTKQAAIQPVFRDRAVVNSYADACGSTSTVCK